MFVDRGGGQGRSPLGRHFGGPLIRIGFGSRVTHPILQLRAESLMRLEAPKQPDRMLPLTGLGMTPVVRPQPHRARTGLQRHGFITGLLQKLSRVRTDRPLLLGRLLQTLLELLAVPLPRLGFDLLLYLQQAGWGRLAHAICGSAGETALTVCSRWRKCRCSG